MSTKTILAASFIALAVSAGAPGVAATPVQGGSNGSGMAMQGGGQGMGPAMMGGGQGMGQGMMGSARSSETTGGNMMARGPASGNMMGMGRMMGMGGMMDGCPMAMGGGLDRKTAMQMHGEMMRAMGDILIKYADKVQEPAAKQ